MVTISGKTLAGPATYTAAGISVQGQNIPITQVVFFQKSRRIPLYVPHGILLSNGSLLRGLVKGMTPKAFKFQSDMFGSMTIPASKVRAIIYSETPATMLQPLSAKAPEIIFKNATSLPGTLAWMDSKAIGFQYSGEILPIKLDRLQCLVLHPGVASTGAKTRTLIRLKNGDLWAADSVDTTASSVNADDRVIPWQAIAAIWTESKRCIPITNLPRTIDTSWPSDTDFPPPAFPPAKVYINQSKNGFLTAHDQYFESGFACRPISRITFQTDGSYNIFTGCVAIRGSTPVTIQIIANGKVILRRLIYPGKNHWIHQAIPGAKTLVLQTLSGPASLLTPRVIWGDPYLIK